MSSRNEYVRMLMEELRVFPTLRQLLNKKQGMHRSLNASKEREREREK